MSTISKDLFSFAKDELIKLSKIPSISFEGFDPKEVEKSAEATADLLRRVGFQKVDILRLPGGCPNVVGEFMVDPKLPTALLYAHHDVQPPLKEELWKTPPFTPTEVNGRLYGRGTADDKAGILVHVAALKYFTEKGGKPPINLKILIEGEEEIGSPTLLDFLKTYRDRLQADVIIVTDTLNIKGGVPSVTVSLRGLTAVDVEVRSLNASVHSGLWGGAIADPVQTLCKMIASLTNSKGELEFDSLKNLPNFPSTANVPLTREEFATQSGVVKAESIGSDFLNKTWYQPSLSVNAFEASSKKLVNNVICDQAFCRVGIRVPPGVSAKNVQQELMQKLKDSAPSTVELKLTPHGASDGWFTDPYEPKNRSFYAAAEKALGKAFPNPLVYIGCGASIPFIGPFEKALEAPVITLGIEDPLALAHSENESLLIEDFYRVIEGQIYLWQEIAERSK